MGSATYNTPFVLDALRSHWALDVAMAFLLGKQILGLIISQIALAEYLELHSEFVHILYVIGGQPLSSRDMFDDHRFVPTDLGTHCIKTMPCIYLLDGPNGRTIQSSSH